MSERKVDIQLIWAVALSFLLATAPLPAQQPASPSVENPAHRAKAMELAQVIQPTTVVIPAGMAALDTQFVETLRAQQDVAALEAEYPGIVEATWKALRPVMQDEMERSMPKLWGLIADIYVRNLTIAQIEAAKAFFSSATGQKFVLLINRNVDVRPMLEDVATDPNVRFDDEDYDQFVSSSAKKTAEQMSPAEVGELSRFLSSPDGLAIQKVIPEMRQLGVSWFNADDPEFGARVEKVTMEAMMAYVERQDAKRAGGK